MFFCSIVILLTVNSMFALENSLHGGHQNHSTEIGDIYPEDAGILPHDFIPRSIYHIGLMLQHILFLDRNIPICKDIRFFLVTRENVNQTRQQLLLNDPITLRKSHMSRKRKTIFVTHGWTDDSEHSVFKYLQIEILKTLDVNIIMVDWKRLAGQYYPTAANTIPKLANYTSQFIEFLNRNRYIKIQDLHLIGHSLGGQTSGLIGHTFKGIISRITALDPAGPLFEFFGTKDLEDRLDPTDAQFVNVIHTTNHVFGVAGPVGHVDFYPNLGNMPQSGCNHLISAISCSHVRAVQYLYESVNTPVGFWGVNCRSRFRREFGFCTEPIKTALMGFWTPETARGSFYLNTNPRAPYAQGPFEQLSLGSTENNITNQLNL